MALATLNVNGWMRRSRESRRTPPRRESVLSMATRHKLDMVALQETHILTPEARESQSWWLRKQGFGGLFNLQSSSEDKGSSALIWRSSVWTVRSAMSLSTRLLITELASVEGGAVRVLSGHFSCDATERRE